VPAKARRRLGGRRDGQPAARATPAVLAPSQVTYSLGMAETTDSPARITPNRTPPGVPELDALVAEMRKADSATAQRVIGRQVLHRGHLFNLERDVALSPGGDRLTRDVVVHPGAVVIVPLDSQDRLLLVAQYRLPAGGTLLELPAGTLDEHEGVIEDPLVAAHRELEEETGFRAGSMERIGGFWSAPGFSTEYLTLYLARDLREANENRLAPDLDEDLSLVVLPLAGAVAAIEAGLIEDAKSIAGILLVVRRLGLG
jgi:ADP-ribose pyrophosphatase